MAPPDAVSGRRSGSTGFRSTLQFYLIDCSTLPGKLIDILIIVLNLAVCAILVVETYPVSDGVCTFMWRAEIVIVAVFIVEYGVRLYAARDRVKQVRDVYSVIDLIPWQISRIVKEWIHIARKRDIVCKRCGLRYHDEDASHCKFCGHIIYQEYEGN